PPPRHSSATKHIHHLKHLPLDLIPDKTGTTPDRHYLLTADPHNVVVYNFEEFKPRKTWKFDENVTAIAFDEENKQLGILTDDGILSVYDTRNFGLKHTVEDLGDGLDFAFNFDGKYVAAVVSPEKIAVVNILRDTDREFFDVPGGRMSEILFVPDCYKNSLLAFNRLNGINVKRMNSLAPYYGKLIADEVASRMNEWLKMAPGESVEQYRERVNDLSRARQQRLFEDEISTQFANNLLSTSAVTLGKYDRANQMLEVDFDNMPSIFLPVPEADLADFNSADDLSFYDTKYGIMPDDNFELIYAKIRHKGTNRVYVYDNLDRKPLNFFSDEDNIVSIAVIQQQQLEEMKLQELRRQIVEEAKSQNVISDHTNITVDSRVEPSYDSNGKKILNYVISFAYQVEPGFSAEEDFGPGKYHAEESGAATAMLKIIKEAFDGDFAQYLKEGKKVNVKISGAADATPILRGIKYDGVYGDFDNEIVYQNGQMTGLSVNEKDGITENEQLAFLRAYGVRDYIAKNVPELEKMNSDYQYHIAVSDDKGSEFRRITTEFTLIDIY
ncbi:MAG: WD40 repeat domain-containing protein, partial [Muribaculaceae bacterium]|nr:WD40 repeat domain-containing protein [Muribaculaceae bacterium]